MHAARELSPYDRRALDEIAAFRKPVQSRAGRALSRITAPAGKAADLVTGSVVGEAVTRAIQGILSLLNDGASWSVRTEAIHSEFRSKGHSNVHVPGDIHGLELEQVDRTVGYLATKYKALAAAEGAGVGALGGLAILGDIPLLAGLALRAVNEFAAYYGFDTSLQSERMFALSVLTAASSPTVAAKQVTLAELSRASVLLGQRAAWGELERGASVNAFKASAEALGMRLTKRKLAQLIPVAGAVVGAGFNAWYLNEVTHTAYMLYRERFLRERYGAL
ncbi:MAG TPA: EcsC family protein [Myxococcaceae bacterium]|jgi:hypothetical protein